MAIIVEGSPFVLTAPMVYRKPPDGEDYYSRTIYASLAGLWYLAFLIAISPPLCLSRWCSIRSLFPQVADH